MFYLTQHYLNALKSGGFHVLYSLSDFDNLSFLITTENIASSIIIKQTLSRLRIAIKENTYLGGLWLRAWVHVDKHGVAVRATTSLQFRSSYRSTRQLTRLRRGRDSESSDPSSSKRKAVVESSVEGIDEDNIIDSRKMQDLQNIWDDERAGRDDDDEGDMDDFIEYEEEEAEHAGVMA